VTGVLSFCTNIRTPRRKGITHGYRVSGLAHVPENKGDWHLYVVGTTSWEQDRWLKTNFNALAADIGPDGVIVAGHDQQLKTDIRKFSMKYSETKIENLIDGSQFCILSRGDLLATMHPIYFIPLPVSGERGADVIEVMDAIIRRIVNCISSGKVADLLRELQVEEVRLKGGGSYFISTMKKINEVIQLKPNLFGIEINLNAVIESFLKNQRRTI
jgi:hypothetical protein